MTKTSKAAVSKPATPAKAPKKNAAMAAVTMSAVAEAKKLPKAAVAAQPAKTVTNRKSLAPFTRAQARAKPKLEVSPEQRRCYVEVAAYFIAERHGFAPAREHDDWAAAESEIDRMIADGLLRTE